QPVRKRLPQSRPSRTTSFSVGGSEGYVTAGEYPDDGIGEMFLKVSKQGSTLSGVMDAFAIAVSLGLQYGVPLEAYVSKFINMKFEPSGMTTDPDIRFASSLVDYVFRRLAIDYLPASRHHVLGYRHVQLAMPPGEEPRAEAFYSGLLGLPRVEKPAELAGRGGCWFRGESIELHLGVEESFRPARKAHPAILVDGL